MEEERRKEKGERRKDGRKKEKENNRYVPYEVLRQLSDLAEDKGSCSRGVVLLVSQAASDVVLGQIKRRRLWYRMP